jgi:hypothetical protein
LRADPPIISPLYAKCEQFGREYAAGEGDREDLQSAVINLASFDISTDVRRVLTQAYPLLLNDAREFQGCIFWESELQLSFNQTIIPQSFYRQKHPFIQFRMPQPGARIGATTSLLDRSQSVE